MVVRAAWSVGSTTVTAVCVCRSWVDGAGRANGGGLPSMLVS
jgi:hypothetical protein